MTASTAMVQEREAGTLEQLLMTPSSTTEIIVAKIAPLFFLLSLMAIFGIVIMKVVFDVPFHGNALLFFIAVALSLLTGIGLGTVIATLTSSAQQAQLATFFMNPLMVSLSGAFSPPICRGRACSTCCAGSLPIAAASFPRTPRR